MEWIKEVIAWFAGEEGSVYLVVLRVIAVVAIGLPLVHIFSLIAAKITKKRFSEHSGVLIRKAVSYTGTIIILIMMLNQMGFKLTVLLGAAGIAGIAIGFAAQTSVSNIISGIFLISEKPFVVGDLIKAGDTLGIVFSIDLLSVKLRKLDNLFVRIPNETLIKTEVTNVTRFPIRRMDLNIGVAYKEDVGKVKEVLADIAAKNPFCLDEPKPLILFKDFGSSALEFMFGLWFVKTDYFALRNSIMQEIKERFDAEGIEIPFPHTTLYTGLATEPFPIRIINDKSSDALQEVEKKD
jgi:small-conductance mechanosensitive channel